MPWTKPTSQTFWRAVEIYLRIAYPAQPPPQTIRDRIDEATQQAEDAMFESRSFERDASTPPRRYSIRLGSRFYPHMKLVIESAPTGDTHFFRVDTHDAHCLPPAQSKEHAAVSALIAENAKLAIDIENAWEQDGLPTFRGFLQADLDRRMKANPDPAS